MTIPQHHEHCLEQAMQESINEGKFPEVWTYIRSMTPTLWQDNDVLLARQAVGKTEHLMVSLVELNKKYDDLKEQFEIHGETNMWVKKFRGGWEHLLKWVVREGHTKKIEFKLLEFKTVINKSALKEAKRQQIRCHVDNIKSNIDKLVYFICCFKVA